jgi:hypothetical protein
LDPVLPKQGCVLRPWCQLDARWYIPSSSDKGRSGCRNRRAAVPDLPPCTGST